MLDEKLNALIEKYGIYDAIGGIQEHRAQRGFLYKKIIQPIKQIIGTIRLAMALNAELDKIPENDIVALWTEGRTRGLIWFWLLTPRNKGKIHFLIKERNNESEKKYHGRDVLEPCRIEKASIDVIIIASWQSEKHAYILSQHFIGKIMDFSVLSYEYDLARYFIEQRKENPYSDIFVSRYYVKNNESFTKKIWYKRLVAHYIRARDFLSAEQIIKEYKTIGYEDSGVYCKFWNDVEKLLFAIRNQLLKRKQRDIFVHWLDQMEKEDFFSMQWVGRKNKGLVFHNAYTTMTNTTAVMRSIFRGENVKDGELMNLKKLKLSETVFSKYPTKKKRVRFFSNVLRSKLDDDIEHDFYKWCLPDAIVPAMIGIWYALDALMDSENAYVIFLHCMETHTPFQCGELDEWENESFVTQVKDYTNVAKESREYIDKELEWYSNFFPENSIRIYMSDHGNEQNSSEENINMPFKIVGENIKVGDEFRLFSYIDMHKLLDVLFQMDEDFSSTFGEYAKMDIIDPYDPSYGQGIRKRLWTHFLCERKEIDKITLKKYIQTTKVVTAEGEYYTINILGEETYYRDKECKVNLIDDSAYADRIAELREKAGKFYNPWKEKRQVAIDFYEYLGIEEKDVANQCY